SSPSISTGGSDFVSGESPVCSLMSGTYGVASSSSDLGVGKAPLLGRGRRVGSGGPPAPASSAGPFVIPRTRGVWKTPGGDSVTTFRVKARLHLPPALQAEKLRCPAPQTHRQLR